MGVAEGQCGGIVLSDVQIRKAKAQAKPYKLSDSEGLFLYVTTAGAKLWRLKYRYGGKEKLLSIGPYPDVSLADAREARRQAKELLRAGEDPGIAKKQRRIAAVAASENTFELVARGWHALQAPGWAKRHADDVLDSMEKYVFPELGALPITKITTPMVLKVLRDIEKRPAIETARRVRQRISAVFIYAISTGLAEADPAATMKSAMAPLIKGKQPALTGLDEVRGILKDVARVPGHPTTKLGLFLLALTAVRPGVVAETPWTELDAIDPDVRLWLIPPARMKGKLDQKREFLTPVARQVVDLIEALRPLSAGKVHAFPNTRHPRKPMSNNAMGYLLNRAGYHHRHVPHGFRASFSTVMNERYPLERHIIDFALAHVPKDKVEKAYNRALYLDRRRELMQEWADLLLDGLPPFEEIAAGPRR